MIVAAAPDDTAEIVALWQTCELTRPWNDPDADVALAFATPGSTILVARQSGRIVGSVMAGFDGHRGWIYYLAVAPEVRLGGIGRSLMSAAEDWLRVQGAPKLQLMVRGDNATALDFYARISLERQDVVVLGRFLADTR